jgi:hypothetical protein
MRDPIEKDALTWTPEDIAGVIQRLSAGTLRLSVVIPMSMPTTSSSTVTIANQGQTMATFSGSGGKLVIQSGTSTSGPGGQLIFDTAGLTFIGTTGTVTRLASS